MEREKEGNEGKAEGPALTAMLSGIVVEIFCGFAAQLFDYLVGKRRKMVFEFLIVKVMHQVPITRIAANQLPPSGKYPPLYATSDFILLAGLSCRAHQARAF